jgi:hypothetical protein
MSRPAIIALIVANEIRGMVMTAPAWYALLRHWHLF